MATTYLTFTPSGAGTSRRIGTFSAWVKRGAVSGSQRLWGTRNSDGSGSTEVTMNEHIQMWASSSSTEQMNLRTTAKYRDVGAWYHVVVAYDTTQVTETNRVKLYVNGIQNSTFSTYTNYPALNDDLMLGQAEPTSVGRQGMETGNDFNGLMAHVHYCDGTQYAASNFGSTDATSGSWVPISEPSVTYGTNGFFLKMASGALGTDSSGNGHTMTVGGTLTPTKDNAMNNFCTMNPLDNYYPASTFSNGNNTIVTSSSNYSYNTGTMGLSTGLWYYEVKVVDTAGAGADVIGIASVPTTGTTDWLGKTSENYSYYGEDGKSYTNNTGTTYGDSFTTDGTIIGVYLDLTANKLYFSKNGTVQNSGTGISITASASTASGLYLPAVSDYNSSDTATYAFNFGNGYFGTTAVTSGVADAGGEGTFEYDPSAGTFDSSSKDFRAICTNNLATYG